MITKERVQLAGAAVSYTLGVLLMGACIATAPRRDAPRRASGPIVFNAAPHTTDIAEKKPDGTSAVAYAGRKIVTTGPRGFQVWYPDAGAVKNVQLGSYGGDPPGIHRWNGGDTYQFISALTATERWVVTDVSRTNWVRGADGKPVRRLEPRRWVKRTTGEFASGITVTRIDGPEPVYIGHLAAAGDWIAGPPAIVGDTAYVDVTGGVTPRCRVVDLAAMSVTPGEIPCPPAPAPQASIDGITYDIQLVTPSKAWRLVPSGTPPPVTPTPQGPPQPTATAAPSAPTPTPRPSGQICQRGFQCYDCVTFAEVRCPDFPTPTPQPTAAPGEEGAVSLQGGRFKLVLEHGGPGAGRRATGVRLTDNTAYFWFFTPDNVELTVKVLDGRGITGSWWVFYAAMTDVQWSLLVEDTVQRRAKFYVGAPGRQSSGNDTGAFPAP